MRILSLILLLAFIACSDSNPAYDPLASSKDDRAIERRLTGHTLRYSTERWTVTWKLQDETYAFTDSLDGKLRIWFRGPWWVRDDGFYFVREVGSEGLAAADELHRIAMLPLVVRGESLYGEIQVVLNGLRYQVE